MKSLLTALLLSLLMVTTPVYAKHPPHHKAHAKVATMSTIAAINKASRKTGVHRNVLAGYASLETGFNPHARNKSGARGMLQIMPKTFRYLARTYGREYDIGKADINNPYHASVLAGAYIKENRQILRDELNRTPSDEECYLAYFIGPQNAIDMIEASGRRDAVKMLPSIARGHKKYFYTGRRHNNVSEFRTAVYRDFRKHLNEGMVAMQEPYDRLIIADLRKPHPYL